MRAAATLRAIAALIVLLSACVLTSTASAQIDPTGLLAALQQGNAAKVEQIIRTKSINPHIAKIARAQLAFDLPRLLQLAKHCQHEAITDPDAFSEALYCYGVAFTTASSLGEAHELVSEELWYKLNLLPMVKQRLPRRPITNRFVDLDTDRLKQLVIKTPVASEEWQAGQATVPITHAEDFSLTTPKIPIDINGHLVTALVDTRLSGPTPLLIVEPTMDDESNGSQLDLKALIAPAVEPAQTNHRVHDDHIPGAFKIASTVTIGPLTIRHLLVTVAKTDRIPSGIYITMSLLRRFAWVQIGKDSVSFGRRSARGCKTSAKMVFASNDHENGSLIFPVKINGQETTAAFFSDQAAPLAAGRGTVVARGPRGDRVNASGTNIRQGPINVALADQHFVATYAVLYRNWEAPSKVVIGSPVLESRVVRLYFDGPRPVICIAQGPVTSGSKQ